MKSFKHDDIKANGEIHYRPYRDEEGVLQYEKMITVPKEEFDFLFDKAVVVLEDK